MYIFLSYAREAEKLSECVSKVSEALEQQSYNVFLDSKNIEPSEIWRKKINDAIEKADIFVIFFSKEILIKKNDRFIHGELERIKNSCEGRKKGRKFQVIPILFDSIKANELPDFFQNYNAITNTNCEVTIAQIEKVLSKADVPPHSLTIMATWVVIIIAILTIAILLKSFVYPDISTNADVNKPNIQIAMVIPPKNNRI